MPYILGIRTQPRIKATDSAQDSTQAQHKQILCSHRSLSKLTRKSRRGRASWQPRHNDAGKAVDRGMTITGVRLLEKQGGKSGHYVAGS